MFCRSATVWSTGKDGMRLVDEYAGIVRFRDIKQTVESRKISVHRINSLYDNKLATSFPPRQRRVQRSGIVMLEPIHPAPRQHGAIAQTQVGAMIKKGHLGLAKQAR